MKIAIIGAGAAGLMAAATIAESSDKAHELFLIERNSQLGKKVLISGGGRCNVTTGIRNMRELLTRYPRGSKFLQSALYSFPPESVYQWFESHGVPLKTEADQRVFPISNNGQDIVSALSSAITTSTAHILNQQTVTKITPVKNYFEIEFKQHPTIIVDRVVIATGGQTYRHTGSTGDGYTFAERCGHTITPLAASLSSFISKDQWVRELAGVSWQYAGIELSEKKLSTPVQGPFMFTHTGITGPAIFAFSALTAYEPVSPTHPLTIRINLFPHKHFDELIRDLFESSKLQPKKSIQTIISGITPKSLAQHICTLAHIDPQKHAGEISKKEFQSLAETITALPIHTIGRGAGDEFVTAGGVSLDEVNPSTMESRITPGLFFAGEILNVDGFTGGFNLQASWATGRLAGQSAMRY